jgi:hypothetical protein
VVSRQVINTGEAIQLASLTLPHFCACHKPEPRFLTSYVMILDFRSGLWRLMPLSTIFKIQGRKPEYAEKTNLTFVYCVQLGMVRSDCSFWWYWWNCWSSLFKLSFHKVSKTTVTFMIIDLDNWSHIYCVHSVTFLNL